MSRNSKRKQKMRRREEISRKAKTLCGKFSSAPAGFGFVAPENGGPDIFIPARGTAGALDGDIVELRVYEPDSSGCVFGHPSRGPVGYISQVLKRGRRFVVARLETKHDAKPLDRHLPESIPVNSVPRGAKPGDWVRLRLLADGSKHTETLRGGVSERLGPAGTVKGDLDAIVSEFDLCDPYTPEQETAAKKLAPASIDREDLTSLFTVTIDPEDAHDFDDAVSVAPGGRNELILGVHIADVAAWVRPGSVFDKEASRRGFSAYLPGRFLPMLPKPLTAKISLREGEKSPAHSVLFTIRKSDGKILSFRRAHTFVTVTARLNYSEVRDFLQDEKQFPSAWTKEFRANLALLGTLAKRMRALRLRKEQFLDLDTVETRAVCDEKTFEITSIERRVQSDSDRLVEEFMLAANSAVASELIERNIPGLFRIHPEPDPEKIEDFSEMTEKTFGIHTGDILSSRTACRYFLDHLPDDHRKPVILSNFLRSLPRASYMAEPALHFGLGKVKYCHFTSPIRRYPDLLVHQQLWNSDTNKRMKSKKILAEIASDCSEKEERTDNAFFAANDRMKLHYLKQHHALEDRTLYESVITKITSAGLVCDIPDLGIYGFVPVSELRGGNFRRTRDRGRARSDGSHTEYKIGDFVYLVLDSLDLVRGTAVFRPAL